MYNMTKEELQRFIEELEEEVEFLTHDITSDDDLIELEGDERYSEVYNLEDLDYVIERIQNDLEDAQDILADRDEETEINWMKYNGLKQADFI